MMRRNLDTQGIGKRAFTHAQSIIQDSGHLIQPIDQDVDIGIDGYIRLRKKVKFYKVKNHKRVDYEDYKDTGNLVGVQIKGVSKIPDLGSSSYYISLADNTKFGVNFKTKENLDKHKLIWRNFVGPVILIFVDLKSKQCWWADLNNEKSYADGEYFVTVQKSQVLSSSSFRSITRLGKELFATVALDTINTDNQNFFLLGLSSFKETARELYKNLSDPDESPTINPTLGEVKFTTSGWKHITRLNRRKMRIINSLLLLGVAKIICQTVNRYTRVKQGVVRESNQYIKKAEFITLRANVNFNFRQSAIVQVVLRRIKTFDKLNSAKAIPDQIFFHSVYEPYRKE